MGWPISLVFVFPNPIPIKYSHEARPASARTRPVLVCYTLWSKKSVSNLVQISFILSCIKSLVFSWLGFARWRQWSMQERITTVREASSMVQHVLAGMRRRLQACSRGRVCMCEMGRSLRKCKLDPAQLGLATTETCIGNLHVMRQWGWHTRLSLNSKGIEPTIEGKVFVRVFWAKAICFL
jgi:hypothetical protein